MARRRVRSWVFDDLARLAAMRGSDPKVLKWADRDPAVGKRYRALVEKLHGGTERTRLATQLLQACNWDDRVAARAVATLARAVWRPKQATKKPRGRPGQWNDGAKLAAWLVVEAQHRADLRSNPAASVQGSIEKLFDALPRARRKNGLCVLQDLSDAKRSLYVTRATAQKYHSAGKAILVDNDPAFRDRWNALAERASLAKGKN